MQVEIQEIKIKEPAVTQALAMKDLQKWLDFRREDVQLVTEDDIDSKEEVESDNTNEIGILKAIMMGDLVINEDNSMTYKLMFPLNDDKGNVAVKELNLLPRLDGNQVNEAMRGADKTQPFKLYIGYISVLSGELRGIINKLDSKDLSLLQKVANYFL